MGANSMLDQVISFAEEVDATRVTIVIDKAAGTVLTSADRAPGIVFEIAKLKSSNGGILNDHTARRALNAQVTAQLKGTTHA